MGLYMKVWDELDPMDRAIRKSLYNRRRGLCDFCGHPNKDHVELRGPYVTATKHGCKLGVRWLSEVQDHSNGSGCGLECKGCGCHALIISCDVGEY